MSEPVNTKASTLGGMLIVLFVNISGEDIVRTAILAAIGAAAGFIVSLLLKGVVRWWKKSFKG